MRPGEGAERAKLLFDDLRRVIRGHVDSLSEFEKHVLIIDATSQLFAAAVVDKLNSSSDKGGRRATLGEALYRVQRFPWDSALEAAIVNATTPDARRT